MHTLVREEGITRGLYRGFWPGTLGTIPPYSAYLVVYQFTKYSLARDPCPTFIQSTSPLIAGIIAEIIALGMYVPVDVVVQRMQLTHNVGKSALVVGRQVLHEEGLRGLFRGAFIAAQSYMLASATWWLVYEHTKCQSYRFYDRWFAQRQSRANDHDDVDASAPHGNVPRLLHPDIAHKTISFACGFVAGTASTIVGLPLDVVKTRIQSTGAYSGTWHGLQMIWRTEGIRGLTRGGLPKLVTRGPLSALSSVLYELVLTHSTRH